jgi:hypothetical protein
LRDIYPIISHFPAVDLSSTVGERHVILIHQLTCVFDETMDLANIYATIVNVHVGDKVEGIPCGHGFL